MWFASLRSKRSRGLATVFALLASLAAGAAAPTPEDASGPVTPHIAGGKDSAADDAFVVALLEAGGEDPNEAHYCGGTLIHPRWVLTAAHCVEGMFPSHLEVLVGSRRLDDPKARILPVLEIRIHPDYDRESLEHDLALLLVPPDALTTVASGPLLPLLGRADLERPGEIARAYGWGVTSEATGEWEVTLQTVELPIVGGSLTEDDYGPASADLIYAGYAEGGRNICAGDSGGPLVVHDEAGQAFLAGVVSFSRGDVDCEDPDNYSAFTRVSSYRNWIEGNMRPARTAWESLYGVPADDADDDGDGLSNYAEFAFARNPLVPEQQSLLKVTSVAPLRLEFTGREIPGENEFIAQHSTDLVEWAREDASVTSDRSIVSANETVSPVLRRWWTFPADAASPAFYQIVAEPRSDFAPILFRLEGHTHLRAVLHPEQDRSRFFPGEHPAQSFNVRNDGSETATLRLILDSSQITPVLTNEPDPLDPSAPFAEISLRPQTHGPGGWDLTLPPGTRRWFEITSAEGVAGEYHLVLFSPPHFSGQLPDGGTLEGELRSTDPVFTFGAEETVLPHHLLGLSNWTTPGLYSVRLRSPGLDGFLQWIDFGEEAATIASDDGFDTGLDPYLDVYLPSLIAREYLGLRLFSIGSNPHGPYHLTVEKLPRFLVGETLAGDLAPTDPLDPDYARSYYRDDYELVGPKGRSSVRLRMLPDDFDAVLVVLDPATDKQIGYIDEGWAAEEEVLELPTEPGRLYRLRATSYGERETGSYTIRAE